MPYPSTVTQLEKRISDLATAFPAICTRSDLSATHEGRKVSLLRIGTGTGEGRPCILITAGLHAREWAPPDAVLTFLERLLEAYKKKKPAPYPKFDDSRSAPTIGYKKFTIPFPDIQRIIERTELYVIPLANPDGRAFTMPPSKVAGWRKNKRPAPAGVTCPALPALPEEELQWVSNDPMGVDINRNFNFAFADTFYSAAAEAISGGHDECDRQQSFHGPTAGSEPETQNIQNTITGKHIKFFLDVHSAAGKFLFAWALAENQDTAPANSFKNTDLDRKPGTPGRDPRASTPYKEWVPAAIIAEHKRLGDTMADAILDSTGYSATDTSAVAKEARVRSVHTPVQAVFQHGGSTPVFYSGASRDFAFSQQIGSVSGTPIQAFAADSILSFTFECGRKVDGYFQPDATKHYPKVEREVGAALAAFLKFVAAWRAPILPPPPPPMRPPPNPEAPLEPIPCFIASATYGSSLHPRVCFLRDLRDREVRATDSGRRVLSVVEPPYYRFGPRMARFLTGHSVLRGSVRLGIVAPAIGLIRGCAALVRRMEPRERRVRWLLGLVTGGGMVLLGTAAVLAYLVGRLLNSQ